MWMYKARRAEKRVRAAEGMGGVGGCDTAFSGEGSWVDFRSDLRRAGVAGDVGGCVGAKRDEKAFWRDG
jgi:hypothetical protein